MAAGPAFALGTFSIAGAAPFAAMVREKRAIPLASFGEGAPTGGLLDVFEQWETLSPWLNDAAQRWGSGEASLVSAALPISTLAVHAPFVPRQIFGIGANYRKHVIELVMGDPSMRSGDLADPETDEETRRAAVERMMDERAFNAQPYCFTKLPTSIAGPFDALELPGMSQKVDWECELAVVIGRTARHVRAEDAAAYIGGYAIANDVTARDLVLRQDVKALGSDWLSAKSQPGFTPFGPYVVPAQFIDPYDLRIQLTVNGRVMQDERTSDMLISIDRQIAYLSSRVKLLPGDIILTGSPAGNGSHHGVFLQPGDVMVGAISGLGEQNIQCVGAV